MISKEPIALQLRFLQTMREISSEHNTTTFLPLNNSSVVSAPGPSAFMTPNSRVRALTEKASTPATPTTLVISPITRPRSRPKTPTR